eukprot:gene16776-23052_t
MGKQRARAGRQEAQASSKGGKQGSSSNTRGGKSAKGGIHVGGKSAIGRAKTGGGGHGRKNSKLGGPGSSGGPGGSGAQGGGGRRPPSTSTAGAGTRGGTGKPLLASAPPGAAPPGVAPSGVRKTVHRPNEADRRRAMASTLLKGSGVHGLGSLLDSAIEDLQEAGIKVVSRNAGSKEGRRGEAPPPQSDPGGLVEAMSMMGGVGSALPELDESRLACPTETLEALGAFSLKLGS